jgi:hypothetical protein
MCDGWCAGMRQSIAKASGAGGIVKRAALIRMMKRADLRISEPKPRCGVLVNIVLSRWAGLMAHGA